MLAATSTSFTMPVGAESADTAKVMTKLGLTADTIAQVKAGKKHSLLGRFFHHENKSEEEARQEDPTPEPSHQEKKHGFLHKLFHRGD